MVFLDTNVLLYAISSDTREEDKRRRAIEILENGNCALSVQVLQEFYVQATRTTRKTPLPHELAAKLMKSWTRFPVQPLTTDVVFAALDIKAKSRFSYWDSAIIAAAQVLGCQTLYTEDMSHGRRFDDLRIVNPFR